MLIDDILEAARAANPSAQVEVLVNDDDDSITVLWCWNSNDGEEINCLRRTINYLNIPHYELIFNECKYEMNKTNSTK